MSLALPVNPHSTSPTRAGKATARQAVGRPLVLLFLAASALFANGCMHRRLTIRSDPPGAAVLVDGEEVGFTPASIDYTYYGTREITLMKDGYKTLTTPVKLSTPWYQVFPLEFVTDNFALMKINDRREVSYALTQEQLEPREFLEDRANNLRSEALRTEMPVP
jgi:PEGA domain